MTKKILIGLANNARSAITVEHLVIASPTYVIPDFCPLKDN